MGDYDFFVERIIERKITGEQSYTMLGSSGCDKPFSEVRPAGGSNSHHETRPATTGALNFRQPIERKTFNIHISSYSYLILACATASWKLLFISAEILEVLNKSVYIVSRSQPFRYKVLIA